MGSELPRIDPKEFSERLRACSPVPLDDSQLGSLYLHFSELRRWNPRLSLVGPGTGKDLVERHYGESLTALPFLGTGARFLVDVGSGAGFPGLILALVRRDVHATLIEARVRKWSFLMSVCRKTALSCTCLNARVGPLPVRGLPAAIDVISSRAVGQADMGLEALLPRLKRDGKILLWVGATPVEVPASMRIFRQLPLTGARDRRILVLVPERGD